jgi:hypothetical protein
MQLFQVKSPSGELIMNAPLETIQRVWHVDTQIATHILRHTIRLDQEYILGFAPNGAAVRMGWPARLHIQRLPLEIPSVPDIPFGQRLIDSNAPTRVQQRLDGAVAAWNDQIKQHEQETDLGRLLCDE